ncbi:unnamed protein product [Dimorphilus gyrociliatus]|uniref:Uncharacterized protein n=1 Tax=Dimorphilus gyrociliatus TaxID=2664684 RepID=A0A7I8WDD6_9ANNE|nr:unnamed protein product [Dimorphilus gyrociliatus]
MDKLVNLVKKYHSGHPRQVNLSLHNEKLIFSPENINILPKYRIIKNLVTTNNDKQETNVEFSFLFDLCGKDFKKVLIKGVRGIGKSFQIKKLLSIWANNERNFSPVNVLFLLVDLKDAKQNQDIFDVILHQNFHEYDRIPKETIKHFLLRSKEFKTFLLFDGFDYSSSSYFKNLIFSNKLDIPMFIWSREIQFQKLDILCDVIVQIEGLEKRQICQLYTCLVSETAAYSIVEFLEKQRPKTLRLSSIPLIALVVLILIRIEEKLLNKDFFPVLNGILAKKVDYNPDFTYNQLAETLLEIIYFESLDLSQIELGNSGLTNLSSSLSISPYIIRVLNFSDCALEEAAMDAFKDILKHFSHLEELNLGWNNIGVVGMKKVSPALLDVRSTLKIFKICSSQIEKFGVQYFVESFVELNSLNMLDFSWNKIEDYGLNLISSSINKNHYHLKSLKLWKCNISSKGMLNLSKALNYLRYLNEIDLSWNDIGDTGLQFFHDYFYIDKTKLMILKLTNCGFSDEGAKLLSQALLKTIFLEELQINRNKIEDSGIKSLAFSLRMTNHRLKILNISSCHFGVKGSIELSKSLHFLKDLEELYLGWNKIEDTGLKYILEHLFAKKLKILNLKDSCLRETGGLYLGEYFATNNKLEELYLENNELGEKGINLFCQSLKESTVYLKNFNLAKCFITPKAVDALSKKMINFKYLENFDLGFNDFGPEALNSLITLLKSLNTKLKVLKLNSCNMNDRIKDLSYHVCELYY